MRPVAQPLADDAQGHDFDRLVGAGPVSVRALVLAPKRFLERHVLGDRDGQLEGLTLVAAIGRAGDADGAPDESLGGELGACLAFQARERLRQLGRVETSRPASPGPDVVVLDLGVEEAEGREEPGRGRNHHPRHLQRPCHARGKERAVAAEGEERVLARVTAPLARDRPDGAHHV
jgi:hypothetical protein